MVPPPFVLRVTVGSLLPFPTLLGAQVQYQVALQRENRVRFVSDAPLEDFQGITDRIDGFVFLEGAGLGGETDLQLSELYFEVDLASLDTGIGLRNRHMRDNYLETDRFPFAVFRGRITSIRPAGPEGFRVTTVGALTIHGVKRDRELECRVGPVGDAGIGGDLRIQCAFAVALSDHDVPIPRLMFMKIDEMMELDLDFYLTPTRGGQA